MKPLPKNTLITIMGRPATGKTCLAIHLATVFGIVYVSTSEIREQIQPGWSTKDCLDQELRKNTYAIAIRVCQQNINSGTPTIFDAGLGDIALREAMFQNLFPHTHAAFLVQCECNNPKKIEERIKKRQKNAALIHNRASTQEVVNKIGDRYHDLRDEEKILIVKKGGAIITADTDKNKAYASVYANNWLPPVDHLSSIDGLQQILKEINSYLNKYNSIGK